MRLVMMIAALGAATSFAMIAPATFVGKAQASMMAEDQRLQIRVLQLAQAGDQEALHVLTSQYVAAGKSDLLARTAKAVAALAQQVADTSCDDSAALIRAAITLVSDPAVSVSDPIAATAVGLHAANMVTAMNPTNPGVAELVRAAVATDGNKPVQRTFATFAPKPQKAMPEQEPFAEWDEPEAAPA